MSRPVHRSTLAATIGMIAASAALADRPLASETADAIAAGTCQVEATLLRERARDTPLARRWDTVLSCGLPRDSQVALGYARARSEGQTAHGYQLAGKTSLVPPQAGRTGWGVAYGASAAQEPGQRTQVDEVRIVGLATRELAGGLLVHANLGWSHSRIQRSDTSSWSLGIETAGDLVLAADLFGSDRDRPSASAGVGFTLGGGFSVNLSLALQFDRPRVHTLGLGAKLVF